VSELKGWLLYTKEHYKINSAFAQRFIDLGNNGRSSLKLMFKDDIYYGVINNVLTVTDRYGNSIDKPDFVINRTIDPLFSRHLEAMNVKVFNSSEIAEICNDKSRTCLEMARLNIPMVNTLFLDKKSIISQEFPVEYPAVIKTVGGRGGKEVFLARDYNELRKIATALPSERFVVQKLSSAPGRDVRVFVVGKEIAGAVLRISKSGFKANFSLGGNCEPYKLSREEKGIVNRIIDRFDFGMVGIDFIFDDKGSFLFNEIEDVAGSRTLSMTSSIDIVKLYLDHIFKSFGILT